MTIEMTESFLRASNLLRAHVNMQRAQLLQRYFKTGKGEYAEGDLFLGLTMPQVRSAVAKCRDYSLSDIMRFLTSTYHEERMFALLVLVYQFQHGDDRTRKEIYDLYLAHTSYINNWDLVDSSAPYIVGAYLDVQVNERRRMSVLRKLAKSSLLWERRIAVLSTFYYINKGRSREAVEIATLVLHDSHDLIHKAAGWMLREVGKRVSLADERAFLDAYASVMPRTMLRYAIEKFPPRERAHYLSKRRPQTSSNQ